MKTLTRVAVYALVFSVAPISLSYAQDPVDLGSDMAEEEMIEVDQMVEDDADLQAMQDEDDFEPPTMQEAKEALEAMPGAKDAVKGEVPSLKDKKVYDIYGRQLAYREGTKEYRKSLDKRREEFSKPRTEAIERYKKTRDTIYAAETAEYQRKLREENEAKSAEEEMPKLPTGEALEAVQEEAVAASEEIGLREQRIPTDPSERRKVVTAGNAPEFDPARLNMKPVPVENVEPPPMPEPKEEVKEEKAPAPAPEIVTEPEVEEVAPVEMEAEEPAPEEVVEPVEEAVEETVEPAEEELDAETEALLEADELDNPFGDEDVGNPFEDEEM